MELQELIRNNGFKIQGEIVLTEGAVLRLMSELQSDKETLLEALKDLVNQLNNEHVSDEFCQPLIEKAKELIATNT